VNTQNESIIAGDDLVVLRRVVADDLALYYTWYKDPSVQEFMSNPYWNPGRSLDDFRELFLRKYLIQTGDRLALTICAQPDRVPVGQAMLFDIERKELRAELGVLIGSPADRRRGYAKRSLEIAIAYASREMGIRRFLCHIMKENTASLKLFTGIGFGRSMDNAAESSGLLRYERIVDDPTDLV